MDSEARVFVAGSAKALGAALVRALERSGFENLVGQGDKEPALSDRLAVERFLAREKPDYVFVAGGAAGGIGLNQRCPADLITDNLDLATTIIPAAHEHGVRKLLYLASSCCYPKHCPQPMREEHLMTGPLEPTNEPYAVAKIAGLTMCRAFRRQHGCDFIAAIPTNYFGPGDDFSPENSHVVGALMRRMHEAEQQGLASVDIWGTGKPRREFIYVDDLADACLAVMQGYSDEAPINLGTGESLSIAEIAGMIKKLTGFAGELRFDDTKPDGMMVKILDSSKLQALGWKPDFGFQRALEVTYQWFLSQEHGVDTAPRDQN